MFDPPNFPNINTNDEFDTGGGDGNIINAGEYKKVKIDNDDTLTFDTSNGQDFLIEKIEAKSKSVLNFQPGRYFIDEFQADDDVVLNVLNGGPVEIFIGDKLEPKKGAEFNTGGSPGDLIIRLYQGAEAKFKEESEFTSTIYAPGDNSKIEFKKESVVNGGVFTRGEVKIDKDTELFYGADAEQAGREVAQCDVTPELILEYRMEEPSWDGTRRRSRGHQRQRAQRDQHRAAPIPTTQIRPSTATRAPAATASSTATTTASTTPMPRITWKASAASPSWPGSTTPTV